MRDRGRRQARRRMRCARLSCAVALRVFLELGVGFNTPGIIRFPFERMLRQNPRAALIRMNRDFPLGAKENERRTFPFAEEMQQVVAAMLEGCRNME